MDSREWYKVDANQTLRFFFERLRDVSESAYPPVSELLYNASMLAHFATTSTCSVDHFPATPRDLGQMFDTCVLDRSWHLDSDILEASASQCLVLTGFFCAQQVRRYNVEWYADLGAGYFQQAAQRAADRDRARMMRVMAGRFEFWRYQQDKLARELREAPLLLRQ